MVIETSTEAFETSRHMILTKIATHLELEHQVLWKQVGDVYYIQVPVERRRYMCMRAFLRE